MTSRSPDKFVREVSHAIVPGHRVVQTSEVTKIGSPHAHPTASATVELLREGDIVKAIDVTCSCGEKIRIWCSYAAKP